MFWVDVVFTFTTLFLFLCLKLRQDLRTPLGLGASLMAAAHGSYFYYTSQISLLTGHNRVMALSAQVIAPELILDLSGVLVVVI